MALLAAQVAAVPVAEARRIGSRLAAASPRDIAVPLRVSGLNYDCTPLQLCATSAPGTVSARVLADPASGEPDLGRRYERALAAMAAGLAAHAPELEDLCMQALQAHVPLRAAAEHPDGSMWLAAGLGRPGFALYVDARHSDRAAAQKRIREWLEKLAPRSTDTRDLIATMEGARLQSVGIEGTSPTNARAKVYWRLPTPRRLAALGLERFSDPRFASFLAAVMGSRAIRPSGIVLSAGISVATGLLSDVKLDVCACPNCLTYAPDEWEAVLALAAREHDLVPLPIARLLEHAEMAFVGFGIAADGSSRLNAYLKAPPQAR
jgi:hypothetical protein